MEIDFEKMDWHVHELMRLCSMHLNHILNGYKGQKLDVRGIFSLDTTVNAKATVEEGRYSITLNNGTYIAVQRFYHTRFFGRDKTYYAAITKEEAYNEETARYYYDLMMDITLMSFLYHEYGHIYGGHLDYITDAKRKKGSPDACCEMYSGETPVVMTFSAKHHQALEWNADDFSATRVIEMLFSATYWSARSQQMISGPQLLWTVINSVLVSYCLLGSNTAARSEADLEMSIHLPANYRAIYYVATANQKLRKWYGAIEGYESITNSAITLTNHQINNLKVGRDLSCAFSPTDQCYFSEIEYELLVKLPVVLAEYQYLNAISPELMLTVFKGLLSSMEEQQRSAFERMVSNSGRTFSMDGIDSALFLAKHTDLVF